jgi:Ca2+-dependent lipid-binding protein
MLTVAESGLLVFTIIDGDNVRPNCHLEVLMDDLVYPSFASNKIRSRHHDFNESKTPVDLMCPCLI